MYRGGCVSLVPGPFREVGMSRGAVTHLDPSYMGPGMLRDTVDKRAVHILLGCILATVMTSSTSYVTEV